MSVRKSYDISELGLSEEAVGAYDGCCRCADPQSFVGTQESSQNVFLAILRAINKDIDNGKQPGEAVTAPLFQAMRNALAEQKQNPLSVDDVTEMIAGQIGQPAPMDEEAADLFQQLAKRGLSRQENKI